MKIGEVVVIYFCVQKKTSFIEFEWKTKTVVR